MQPVFTYEEGALLIRLLIAHIITDFLLQTDSGIKDKNNNLLRSRSYWLHGLYTCLFTILFLWDRFNLQAVLTITLTHLGIDYLKIVIAKKSHNEKSQKDLWLFIIDQLLHILVVIFVWLMLVRKLEAVAIVFNHLLVDYRFLIRILGYLIVVGPTTYLIKFLTLRWAEDVTVENNSLRNAGKWIGILERVIVLTLVFIEQYTAIGFLITAKSILRLIDKPEAGPNGASQFFSSRKHTEYVLIGTFLSFGSAIVIALFINWLLKLK